MLDAGRTRGSGLEARRSTNSTLDARGSKLGELDAGCSTLDARRSTLDARRSTLEAGRTRRSTLDARRSKLEDKHPPPLAPWPVAINTFHTRPHTYTHTHTHTHTHTRCGPFHTDIAGCEVDETAARLRFPDYGFFVETAVASTNLKID
jgi:hypothetical protein